MNQLRRSYPALLLLLAGILLAAVSFWGLEVARRSGTEVPVETVRTEPDYFVENFSLVKIAANGVAEYVVSGKRLDHYPLEKLSIITQPVIKSFSKKGSPAILHARSAEANDDQSKIHLREHVRLERPKSRDNKELIVESEYMLLLPNTNIIKTDKLVTAKLGNSTITGAGMIADNNKQELTLHNKVHANFLPVTAR